MNSLQANHDEFMELIREQENCEDPDRLHQIYLRMSELNGQYFGAPATQPKGVLEVPAE